jgi:hypothetical protein
MARQYRLFRDLKSVAGITLIGLGLFVLTVNLSDACGQFSRLVGISADAAQTFGELTAFGLAASQVWRCYVFDRRELLLGVYAILVSFWPVLLVIAGSGFRGRMRARTSWPQRLKPLAFCGGYGTAEAVP